MKINKLRIAIPALLITFACTATASAQRVRSASVAAIPANVLVKIIRYEDQRNWNDDLKSLLNDKDPQVRKRAALAAGRIGDERAVPPLAEVLLTDRDAEVRQMAAFSLGEIESPGGAYALTEVLKRRGSDLADSAVRARSVEALGKIVGAMIAAAPANAGAVKPLDADRLDILRAAIVDTLRFEDTRRSNPDRLTILLALTAVLRAKPDGVGALVAQFLDYSDPEIVATALNTMARLRLKNANDRVRQLLNHSDPIVRANAARVIGAAEDKGAFDAVLDRALHDSDLRVRVSAIRALGSLKDQRAGQPLLERGVFLSRAANLVHADSSDPKDVGISACDNFLAKYHACVSTRVPEKARDQYESTVNQWRESWRKLANNQQTRGTLITACKLAAEEQETALKSYRCVVDVSEILENVTATGSLLRDSKSAIALQWLRELRISHPAPEVEVAMARIDPELYVTEEAKFGVGSPANLARGLQEISVITRDRPQLRPSTEFIPSWMRRVILCDADKSGRARGRATSKRGCLVRAVDRSPFLEAYAAFKPGDLESTLRQQLMNSDVIVRSTAAELLGNQPSSESNTRALVAALPHALKDRDLNDAALAILDALGKQKNKEANDAIKTALNSDDHLIRRKAVALLKANGVGDFSDRIGLVKTRYTDADYRRAIARIGRKVTATVVTSKGSFTIEFLADDAPLTVDNFIQLAKRGYFNGQTIPRVVPNFVVQAGDPRGDQNGGPGYQIRCEINEVPYERAAVGMALSGKDTGGSQWFVTHSPQPHLDGGYTVFGRVIRGMDVVDNIARGDVIRRVIVSER